MVSDYRALIQVLTRFTYHNRPFDYWMQQVWWSDFSDMSDMHPGHFQNSDPIFDIVYIFFGHVLLLMFIVVNLSVMF